MNLELKCSNLIPKAMASCAEVNRDQQSQSNCEISEYIFLLHSFFFLFFYLTPQSTQLRR